MIKIRKYRELISLIIMIAILGGCSSLLQFPSYYDSTTYKNLTDLKPEVLVLYDSFAGNAVDSAQISALRLKFEQMLEYEKGKGPKNAETAKQIELIKSMYERHVADRLNSQTSWNETHRDNCKENIGEAFDIAISTEALKNKN